MRFTSRFRIPDRWTASLLCSVAILWIVVGVEWFGRTRARELPNVKKPVALAIDPLARAHLHDNVGSIQMDRMPLEEAIALLRQKTGAAITVQWADFESFGISKQTPITATIANIELGSALRFILDSAWEPMQFWVLNGGTIVVGYKGPTKNWVREVYDVRDIVLATPAVEQRATQSFSRTYWHFVSDAGEYREEPYDRALNDEEFVDTLREILKENSVRGFDGEVLARMSIWGHRLSVVADPDTHRVLADILRQLRMPKANPDKTEMITTRFLVDNSRWGIVRVYDVRDRLKESVQQLTTDPNSPVSADVAVKDVEERVCQVLEERIHPGSWTDTGGHGVIRCWSGRIFVRQLPNVQRNVEAFFKQAHKEPAPLSGNPTDPPNQKSAPSSNVPCAAR